MVVELPARLVRLVSRTPDRAPFASVCLHLRLRWRRVGPEQGTVRLSLQLVIALLDIGGGGAHGTTGGFGAEGHYRLARISVSSIILAVPRSTAALKSLPTRGSVGSYCTAIIRADRCPDGSIGFQMRIPSEYSHHSQPSGSGGKLRGGPARFGARHRGLALRAAGPCAEVLACWNAPLGPTCTPEFSCPRLPRAPCAVFPFSPGQKRLPSSASPYVTSLERTGNPSHWLISSR